MLFRILLPLIALSLSSCYHLIGFAYEITGHGLPYSVPVQEQQKHKVQALRPSARGMIHREVLTKP